MTLPVRSRLSDWHCNPRLIALLHDHSLQHSALYPHNVCINLNSVSPNVEELKALVHAISHRVAGLRGFWNDGGCWNAMRRTVTRRSNQVTTTR
jgi:hypothetical protein